MFTKYWCNIFYKLNITNRNLSKTISFPPTQTLLSKKKKTTKINKLNAQPKKNKDIQIKTRKVVWGWENAHRHKERESIGRDGLLEGKLEVPGPEWPRVPISSPLSQQTQSSWKRVGRGVARHAGKRVSNEIEMASPTSNSLPTWQDHLLLLSAPAKHLAH